MASDQSQTVVGKFNLEFLSLFQSKTQEKSICLEQNMPYVLTDNLEPKELCIVVQIQIVEVR